jgi:hypothetical protein
VAVAVALLAIPVLVLAHGGSSKAPPMPRNSAEDRVAWIRVAEELEDVVAPRLLLGGAGSDEALDSMLRGQGFSRADFQRAAASVIEDVGAASDDLFNEALASSFADYPLPEGIEPPQTGSMRPVERSPTFEESRRLVFELTARLQAPESEPEDS